MRTLSWLSAVTCLVSASAAIAQERPPIRAARLCGEAFAGGLWAVAGAYVLSRVGGHVPLPNEGDEPGVSGFLLGRLVGTALGSSAGVHVLSRVAGLPTVYADALGGSVLGMMAAGLAQSRLQLERRPSGMLLVGAAVTGAIVFQEIGLHNRRLKLGLVPGVQGLTATARVEF